MREKPDINWCIMQIEKEIAKHNTPATNIMNIVRHVQRRINEFEVEIDDLQPCHNCGHPKKFHRYNGYVKEICSCEGNYNEQEPCDCECYVKYKEGDL